MGQTFWGVHGVAGLRGRNMLGILLMDVRKRLVHVLHEGEVGKNTKIDTQSSTSEQGGGEGKR